MTSKRNSRNIAHPEADVDRSNETEPLAAEVGASLEPHYENAGRLLLLLSLLRGGDCTREDIFAHMKDDYRVSENDPPKVMTPSGRAGKMLSRDLQALESNGY